MYQLFSSFLCFPQQAFSILRLSSFTGFKGFYYRELPQVHAGLSSLSTVRIKFRCFLAGSPPFPSITVIFSHGVSADSRDVPACESSVSWGHHFHEGLCWGFSLGDPQRFIKAIFRAVRRGLRGRCDHR